MHSLKFCAHLFERSLLRRLFAFYLGEWTQKGGAESTEMGIRTHSLFFHDAVVAHDPIYFPTHRYPVGVPTVRGYHIYQIVTPLYAGSEFLAVLHFPCLIPGNL